MRIKKIFKFITNGFRVFREASNGEYNRESDAVKEMKKEFFSEYNIGDDKQKLLQDRKNVEMDVRNAWDKLKLSHGQATN